MIKLKRTKCFAPNSVNRSASRISTSPEMFRAKQCPPFGKSYFNLTPETFRAKTMYTYALAVF